MALELFCLLAFLLVGVITAKIIRPRGPRDEHHALVLSQLDAINSSDRRSPRSLVAPAPATSDTDADAWFQP